MEDLLGVVLSALIGLVGFMIGTKIQPKHRLLSEANKFAEEVNSSLKTEIRRLRGQLHYYKQGAIGETALEGSDPEQIVDQVFASLPPHFKMLLGSFKPEAVQWAKNNPELVQSGVEILKAKMNKGGQDQSAAPDAV